MAMALFFFFLNLFHCVFKGFFSNFPYGIDLILLGNSLTIVLLATQSDDAGNFIKYLLEKCSL